MKTKSTFKIAFALMLTVMTAFAFSACGDKSGEGGSSSEDKSTAAKNPKEDVESVSYKTSDDTIDEDKYTVEITIEHDGDKVTAVTEVRTDDMSKADNDIATIMMNDYDGALDDSGIKEIDGVKCDVARNGKTRVETKFIDVKKADYSALKDSYIDWETDKDYFSFEDFVKFLENSNFKKI